LVQIGNSGQQDKGMGRPTLGVKRSKVATASVWEPKYLLFQKKNDVQTFVDVYQ